MELHLLVQKKLNKLDEDNIFLEGSSYLENNVYKFMGKILALILNLKFHLVICQLK